MRLGISGTLSRRMQVAWLSVGQGIAVLANIVFLAVAARHLTKPEYATIRQTFLILDVAAPAISLGIPTALFHLLPRSGEDQRRVVVAAVTMLAASGFVLAALVNLFSSQIGSAFDNAALEQTIPWLWVYCAPVLAASAATAVLVSGNKARYMAILTIVGALVPALVSTIVVVAGVGAWGVVGMRSIACAAMSATVVFYMFNCYQGAATKEYRSLAKALIAVGLPLAGASVLGTTAVQLHGLVVSMRCSPEEYAVYINGAVEIPLIGVVTGAITSVVMSGMAAHCAAGRLSEAVALFRVAALRSAAILLPAFAFLECFAADVIECLFSTGYSASVVPFRLVLLALPCRIVVYGAALVALGMSRAILIRSVVDLCLTLASAYVLVGLFGPNGAAAALVVTLVAWTIPFNLRSIAKGFGIRWTDCLPLARIGTIMLISGGIAALTWGALSCWNLTAPLRLILAFVVFTPSTTALLIRSGDLVLPFDLPKIIRGGSGRT